METASVLRILSVVGAFCAAALAFPEAMGAMARMRVVDRASHAAMSSHAGLASRVLRNGFGPATRAISRLCRNRRVAAYCSDLQWLARHRGFETDATRAGGVVAVAAAAVLPLGWAVSSSPVFGAMLPVCMVAGLGMAARHMREREVESMRESVPEMLQAMSACFHAGYSLLQTFRHLAREARGPLARFFEHAESDLETGRTAAEALQRMREDSALPELAFVAAALEIQHQTGGSLQKILDCARDSVEGELALRRSLRVQTAQARLSMRVVTVMPFVLMAVFSLVSPAFLAPFFSSPAGVAVFGLAMCMQAAGVIIVRRMLDVGEG